MPLTSAFQRGLACSSRSTHAERIYHSLLNSLGGQYSTEIGSRAEAWCYATAMLLGRVRDTADRVRTQMDPRKAVELLPIWEERLGIIPSSDATIVERQDACFAKFNRSRIGTKVAIDEALTAALGDDFLAFLPTVDIAGINHPSTAVIMPTMMGIRNSFGNFVEQTAPVKIIALTGHVAVTNASYTVGYARIDAGADESLQVGDKLVVSTNNIGLAEKVTIEAVTPTTFTATFRNAHDLWDVCTTGPFPYWISTQQHALVVVTRAACEDADARGKIHNVMRQLARSVATWDIVPPDPNSTNLIAQFTTDDAVLGRPGYAPLAITAGQIPF